MQGGAKRGQRQRHTHTHAHAHKTEGRRETVACVVAVAVVARCHEVHSLVADRVATIQFCYILLLQRIHWLVVSTGVVIGAQPLSHTWSIARRTYFVVKEDFNHI